MVLCLPFTGETGWFTLWVLGGKQNPGLVTFAPESRLLFVQIGSIYRKADAKT